MVYSVLTGARNDGGGDGDPDWVGCCCCALKTPSRLFATAQHVQLGLLKFKVLCFSSCVNSFIAGILPGAQNIYLDSYVIMSIVGSIIN